MDVTEQTAAQAIMCLANDAEMQLFHTKAKSGPLLHILVEARRESIAAMVDLAKVSPTDAEAVRELQNIVERFNSLVKWINGLLARGDEAFHELQADQEGVEAVRAMIRDEMDVDDQPRDDQTGED